MNLEQRFSTVLSPAHLARWRQQWMLRGFDGVLATMPLVIVAILLYWVTAGENLNLLYYLSLAYGVMFVVRKCIIWRTNRRLNRMAFDYGLEQRHHSLKHLLAIPSAAFNKLHRGTISQSLSEDLVWLETWYSFTAPLMLVDAVAILLLLVSAFFVHWPLALLTVFTLAIAAVLLVAVLKIIHRGHKQRSANLADASRVVAEYVKGMDLLRTLGQTGAHEGQFQQTIELMRQESYRAVKHALPGAALFFAVVQIALAVSILIMLLINQQGGMREIDIFREFSMSSEQGIVQAVAAILLLAALNTPIRSLFTYLNLWQMAKLAAKNLDQFDQVPEQENGIEQRLSQPLAIDFSQVSFRYEGADTDAIKDVSFSLPPCSVTAVVGPSGAGKSTLMQLLMRFSDVSKGSIFLAGQEIRSLDITLLLNQFATVFQESVLFQDSLANNIRVGRPDASLGDIISAAKKACIHDKIASLPQGYETVLGTAGSSLSGGEKQRVAIARAILKDAPIIILDEATSSLDPENEDLIQQAISGLARDKTVLMIAHRLSTIVDVDQILVMDEGEVVAVGEHAVLLQQNPLYQNLWRAYVETHHWDMRKSS